MAQPSNAFDELPEEQKQACVDLACVMSVLITRLPAASDPLTQFIAAEFATHYHLPSNKAKYALKTIGAQLFSSDWVFEVLKEGPSLKTAFRPIKDGKNGSSKESAT